MATEPVPTKLTKFKIICRLTNGSYTEELRRDDVPRTAPYTPEEAQAFRLLHSFSPEQLTRQLCTQTPDGVLVFRTDAVQMGEFDALLHPEQNQEPAQAPDPLGDGAEGS